MRDLRSLLVVPALAGVLILVACAESEAEQEADTSVPRFVLLAEEGQVIGSLTTDDFAEREDTVVADPAEREGAIAPETRALLVTPGAASEVGEAWLEDIYDERVMVMVGLDTPVPGTGDTYRDMMGQGFGIVAVMFHVQCPESAGGGRGGTFGGFEGMEALVAKVEQRIADAEERLGECEDEGEADAGTV